MARLHKFAFGPVAAGLLLPMGCTSTGASEGASEGAAVTTDGQSDARFDDSGASACTSTSVKVIQASDYDQSCTVNTDCRLIAEGNACSPCAFNCPFNAAINVGALAQYNSDVANTPAVAAEFNGQTCLSGCPAAFGPCCVGGKCHTSAGQCPIGDAVDAGPCVAAGGQCVFGGCANAGPQDCGSAGMFCCLTSGRDAGDAMADGGLSCTLGGGCSQTQVCTGGIPGCASNCQCLDGTWQAPCPTNLPHTGSACTPAGAQCGYATSTNACGAANCYCQGGAWSCGPTCIIVDSSVDLDVGTE